MKHKKSILDPFAERLTQWFTPKDQGGDGLTLAQAQSQLALDGCKVSTGRLSEWWAARQKEIEDKLFFANIAAGSKMSKEVAAAFQANPAPEIQTLINVVQSLIMSLQVKGQAEPKYLDMADRLLASVLQFAQMQTQAGFEKLKIEIRQAAEARMERKFQLEREKFQRDSIDLLKKYHADDGVREILGSAESEDAKTEQLGQRIFGKLWK